MDFQKKDLIQKRAESLFPIIRDYLNRNYDMDPSIGMAFKFVYLITHGPRRFLKEFENGDLRIDIENVRNVYMEWLEHEPGQDGLMLEEEQTINNHNTEVDKYLSSRRPATNLVARNRDRNPSRWLS